MKDATYRHRGRSLALGLLLALAIAPAARAGMEYEARTVVEAERGQGSTMVVHGWIDGERGRVEFERVDGPQGQMLGGNYLVTRDGGKTIFLVDDGDRTYSRFDLAGIFGSLNQMMAATGGLVDLDFSDMSHELVSEEPGGAILGHDTTHYRWKTGYTIEVAVMGFKQRNEIETTTDTWVAEDIRQPGFGAWLRDAPAATGDEDLDKMIAAAAADVHGLPLKTVAVSVTRDKKGRESRSTSTTEVTRLEEATVQDSMFEVPAGYDEVPFVSPYTAGH